jgi:hypothetical protein
MLNAANVLLLRRAWRADQEMGSGIRSGPASGMVLCVTRSYRWFSQPASEPVTRP